MLLGSCGPTANVAGNTSPTGVDLGGLLDAGPLSVNGNTPAAGVDLGALLDAGPLNVNGNTPAAGVDLGALLDAGPTAVNVNGDAPAGRIELPDAAAGDARPESDTASEPTGCALARFLGLGDLPGGTHESVAHALSEDGSSVVGQSVSGSGPEAFRWRSDSGMIGLGDLAGRSFDSRAFAVSADGSVVTGVSHSGLVDCPGRTDEDFRWTPTTGMVALGDLSGGCFFSYAYGVSADGTTIVGGATNMLSNTAAIWSTRTNAWDDLGFARIMNNSSSIHATTPDLGYVVGTHRIDVTADYQAFRWSLAKGQELLGDLAGGALLASAAAISDDGAVIVGAGTAASGPQAFRWTATSGMVGLGDLAGGRDDSAADDMSGDGRLIVGYGTTAMGQEAALWETPSRAARAADVFAAHGVVIPVGWILRRATSVVLHEGVILVAGNGTNPSGEPEAWLARYCSP
jgi:probable HAF family extracellular repeat protein